MHTPECEIAHTTYTMVSERVREHLIRTTEFQTPIGLYKSFGNDLMLVQYDYIARSTALMQKNWNKRPLWNRVIELTLNHYQNFYHQ